MAEHKIAKERFQPAHILDAEAEKINRPSLTFLQDSWLCIRKNKSGFSFSNCISTCYYHGNCWALFITKSRTKT